MATVPKVVTYQEWLEMPEIEDGIEEVVDGEIRITPPNKLPHAIVVENLADALKALLDRRTVRVFTTSIGLVIRKEPLTTREPDLAVFLNANIVEQDGYVHSSPDLIVEVLSPGNTRQERVRKLKDYESLGVPEVWVVSPEAQTVEILLLQEGRLTRKGILADGEIRPVRFPGAAVKIESIWPG